MLLNLPPPLYSMDPFLKIFFNLTIMLCIFGMLGDGGIEFGSFVAVVKIVRTLGEFEFELDGWRSRGESSWLRRLGEFPALTRFGEPSKIRLAMIGEIGGILVASPFRLPT